MLAGGTFAVLLLQGPYATGSLLDSSLHALAPGSGRRCSLRLLLTAAFASLVARALRAARRAALSIARGRVRGRLLVHLDAHRPLAHRRADVARHARGDRAPAGDGAVVRRARAAARLRARARRHASLEPVLPRFSRLALVCFAALGVTGVYLAWRQSGALAALPATDFGQLLLIKSAIVLVIVALASVSRRVVARMGGDVGRRLRRTVSRRSCSACVVLGGHRDAGQRRARAGGLRPAGRRRPSPGRTAGSVQLHMEPAKQGENVADIYLAARTAG